ncbi:hypothetical protein [uncultured Xylophilus sp.]|uniref:hypothetical protein n=1 Tax=uncultured Xylophilus sp. TaxID=296832 RepID=UPI0025E87090|nr:hypothetical protein [uncultured Xylophilus sp.]
MPSGKLGAALLAAAADTLLCTGEPDKVTTLTVSLCNVGGATAKVRLAVGTGAAPAAADYLEYDPPINPGSPPLERTGIVISAGEKVWVRSDVAATIAARAHGFVEAA